MAAYHSRNFTQYAPNSFIEKWKWSDVRSRIPQPSTIILTAHDKQFILEVTWKKARLPCAVNILVNDDFLNSLGADYLVNIIAVDDLAT